MKRRVSRHRGEMKARIVAAATSGVPPKELFIAPVSAMERVLAKAGMRLEEIDLFELNEAFAAQSLACMRQLKLPSERTNIYGGAIALGHPIGASGARIVVTLLHAMAARKVRYGLASACLGGGNAVAMIVGAIVVTRGLYCGRPLRQQSTAHTSWLAPMRPSAGRSRFAVDPLDDQLANHSHEPRMRSDRLRATIFMPSSSHRLRASVSRS